MLLIVLSGPEMHTLRLLLPLLNHLLMPKKSSILMMKSINCLLMRYVIESCPYPMIHKYLSDILSYLTDLGMTLYCTLYNSRFYCTVDIERHNTYHWCNITTIGREGGGGVTIIFNEVQKKNQFVSKKTTFARKFYHCIVFILRLYQCFWYSLIKNIKVLLTAFSIHGIFVSKIQFMNVQVNVIFFHVPGQ